MSLEKFHKIISKISQMDRAYRIMALKVIFFSALAKITLATTPFRRIAQKLGTTNVETPDSECKENEQKLLEIRYLIEAVSRYLPWKNTCFNKALCAHWVLKRLKINHTIYFGVHRDDSNKLLAHAWLRSGNQIITGYDSHNQFVVINSYGYFITDTHQVLEGSFS